MDLKHMWESTAQALASGTMMPRLAYTSQEWFEAERPVVHDRAWSYVCHASELPPGSFRRARVGAEDMIVTRDGDGVVHAMHNVCRHRGAEVVTQDCGVARRLVCPYHVWSYDLSGQLLAAPGMPKQMSRSDLPLRSAAVREWHGFVFVALDEDTSRSADFEPATKVPSQLAKLRLEEAKVIHTEHYDVAANWKTVRENFLECYHCAANHPELLMAYDLHTDILYDQARARGDLDPTQAYPYPIKDGMCSLSLDGQPVCKRPFGDFVDVPPSDWAYVPGGAFPLFVVIANPDHVVTFTFAPISAERTMFTCEWLVHRDAIEGVDYETKNVVVVWHQTNLQDIALCESAQRGMRSRAYLPGPLSKVREPEIFDFHQRYVDWLRDGIGQLA